MCSAILRFAATREGQSILRSGPPPEIDRIACWIENTALAGPVNLTGPAPVTNSEFTAALGRATKRPTPWLVPGFALKTLLGEFAEEGLLGGQRAVPAALERAGFTRRQGGGSHTIFHKTGVEEILNLQPIGNKAKAYQVKQVRNMILKHQPEID